jgi:hypothetical protein
MKYSEETLNDAREKRTKYIHYANRLERRIGILLGVIIVIILLLFFPFYSSYGKINYIKEVQCQSDNTAIVSDDCLTGNACQLGIKQRIDTGCASSGDVGSSGESCQQYQCTSVPLETGSCCNRDDFCYFDDPNKKCYQGVCKSLDPTLCKGYCTTDADCRTPETQFPFQINDTAYNPAGPEPYRRPVCIYNSCTQMVLFSGVTTDPLAMIYPYNGDKLLFNFSKCASVVCVPTFFPDNVCAYTWNCAPYLNLPYPPSFVFKRDEEWTIRNDEEVEVDVDDNNISSRVNYSIPLLPVFQSGGNTLTRQQTIVLSKYMHLFGLEYNEMRRVVIESL